MSKSSKVCLRAMAGTAFALAALTGVAAAEDDAISGSAGISYNSHFISYGADVWGGGNDFFGDHSTAFAWADWNIAVNDFNINFGVWADINNNIHSSLGGNIQEIDWYIGGSYNFGFATFGATYQEWNYAGDAEKVLDFALSFDDSEWWGGDFALAPKVVWHIRLDGNDGAGQADGSAIVFSVAPSFSLTESISLTIPAGVAIFMDDDFQGGDSSGYGYSYLGASLGVPLDFIPTTYGAWAMNFDVTAYFTDEDAIPNNPEDTFLVGSVGLKVGF